MTAYDIAIIGAGIAGASFAAALPVGRKVVMLEMEAVAGYHATSRSAANFEPTFGPQAIRALTRASEEFLRNPPDGFAEVPLLSPRGVLMYGDASQTAEFAEAIACGYVEISEADAFRRVPLLRQRDGGRYLFDASTTDIDVDLLHRGFLQLAKRAGVELILKAPVTAGRHDGRTWHLATPQGEVIASTVVIAAGAWADEVARVLGIPPIGFVPKRRSMAVVPAPAVEGFASWPQLIPANDTFYAKPMGGRLMISPSDATPSEPHDAFADDLKIAEAIAAYGEGVDYEITQVERTWGGLRTFAPDGQFVIGHDPLADGIFWLAGQGGYGVQTAPAAGRLAATLFDRLPAPADILIHGVNPADFDPARFNRSKPQ